MDTTRRDHRWVTVGLGISLVIILAVFFAPILRYRTKLDLVGSFFLCLLVSASLGRYLIKRIAALAAPVPIGALAILGCGLVAISWMTFNPVFSGMPITGGSDHSFHLHVKHELVSYQPDPSFKGTGFPYHGFVLLPGAQNLLTSFLRLDDFQTVIAAFFLVLASAWFYLGSVFLFQKSGTTPVQRFYVATLALGLSFFVMRAALLPTLYGNFGYGFQAHVFALVPTLLIAFLYGVSRGIPTLLIFAAGLAVIRHAYILNVGDMAATAAILGVGELYFLGWLNRWWKTVIVSVIAMAAMVFCYTPIIPLLAQNPGVIHPPSINSEMFVLIVLCLANLMTTLGLKRNPQSFIFRINLFAVVFSSSAFLILLGYRIINPDYQALYYFHKYTLHPIVLSMLTFCGSIILALLNQFSGVLKPTFTGAFDTAEKQTPSLMSKIYVLIALLSGGTAIYAMIDSHREYRAQYALAISRRGPWQTPDFAALPLSDRRVDAHIKQALAANSKEFGGLIIGQFPMAVFMNITWFRPGFFRETPNFIAFYETGGVQQGAEYCTFWVESEAYEREYGRLLRKERGFKESLDGLRSARDKSCADPYQVAWDKQHTYQICHTCGG